MKKRTIWDKINALDYIDISDIHEAIHDDYKFELKNSKDQFVFIIITSIILIISGWIYYIKSPDKLTKNFNYLILGGLFFVAGLIYSLYMLKMDKTVLTLTNKAINIKNKRITWDRIKNMYVRKQNTDNGYSYTLILELNIEIKEYLELDGLEADYNKIIYEIGKCYWNWKINNAT